MATTTARGRATKKRQAPKRKQEQDSPKLLGTGQMQNEAGAVILGCVGLLTLLALASYHPGDASLNAGGGEIVRNWIGTAGGYWADLLLQIMGMGAFPFGAGILIAGWRALFGKRLIPGVREAIGSLLLMVSVGTFAHLVLAGQARPYPPGGVVGAVLGQMLYQHLAVVGSVIVSGAMVLISMALTFDGIVGNIGLQGAGMIRRSALRAQGSLVMFRERSAALKERRAELKEVRAEERAQKQEWTLGEQMDREEREASADRDREKREVNDEKERAEREKEREAVLEKARVKGREMAEKQAEKELAKRAREDKETISGDSGLGFSVDLQDEEGFELGCIPGVTEPRVVERSESTALVPVSLREEDLIELEPEDVEEDTPILSAAGPVEQLEMDEEVEELTDYCSQAVVTVGDELELAPQIVDVRKDADEDAIEEAIYLAETEGTREEVLPTAAYELPSINLLDLGDVERAEIDTEKLQSNAVKLTRTLKDYKIEGTVREIRPGPVVTMYEYVPTAGTKVSKISNLSDDLAMSMEALRVRIVAPIPGKGAVGIEIPNETRETVFFKELVAHENFRKSKSKLPIALGKDIEGNAKVVDLARMPHLLVAGATGSGKSVFVNSLIMSILYKSTPDEVRFIMVDPKMLELSVYNAVSHLLLPVVVDPKKAAIALRWGVEEMERRYQMMSTLNVRNIDGYNKRVKEAAEKGIKLRTPTDDGTLGDPCDPMPYLVIIVDELADLMMTAGREVESYIMRLAQKARAAGIHLVLATQRPSVDVITGPIKANLPTRIAFAVSSNFDSKTIIGTSGAENLLGWGDMLYMSPGIGGLERVHGSLVTDEEIMRTCEFVGAQGEPEYDESILLLPEPEPGGDTQEQPKDELFDKAVEIIAQAQKVSVSFIQRKLSIGYNRAARMVEQMEEDGIVGPPNGSKPREVLIKDLSA